MNEDYNALKYPAKIRSEWSPDRRQSEPPSFARFVI
jgi:hypothetical protein